MPCALAGGLAHSVNQSTSHTRTACCRVYKQVLQVAHGRRPHIHMKQVVGDAHQAPFDPGAKAIDLISLQQALQEIARLAPRRALLTHLSHDFEHETLQQELPAGIGIAHDGLQLSFGESPPPCT